MDILYFSPVLALSNMFYREQKRRANITDNYLVSLIHLSFQSLGSEGTFRPKEGNKLTEEKCEEQEKNG
jgi:hypothetical protein